jgi:hypothetical protein
MLVALGIALALVLFFVIRARQKKSAPASAHDSTPEIDAWIADALEAELAEHVLGIKGASDEERKPLARSLRGEPDPDVVGKIEEALKAVELEYVKYSHESDAEVALRVRYEDGKTSTVTKRVPWTDVPEGVRADFERRASTRVFRTWPLPWSRVRAL